MTETIKESNSKWEEKENVAFFRGSRTSEERDPLVKLSRAKPEIVQAAYTKNQGSRGSIDLLFSKPAADVHLKDHCKYKNIFSTLKGLLQVFATNIFSFASPWYFMSVQKSSRTILLSSIITR